MTAVLTPTANVQTNIVSDTAQKMAVDMSGLAHIMSVLTNLYSNPTLAVLREYSVNALDAHVEAGVDRPIEVTLPSSLNPSLVIKDYGIGMSEEDIYLIYAQYGASTKRDDETQVGGFGLGCKSALALTQQFTVTAVKDGQKTVVYFAQGTDGVGTVDTLLRASTDEPNGVEVTVPVTDVNLMVREAENFFRFWQPGTVLVNGQEPSLVWDELTKVTENVYMRSSNNSGFRGNTAVMGSVSYPLDVSVLSQITYNLNNRYSAYTGELVIKVDIGEVDITPSREALNYSDRTKDTLTRYLTEFFTEVKNSAYADIAAASTPLDAVTRANKWRERHWLNLSGATWNDHAVPVTISTADAPVSAIHFANGSRTSVTPSTTAISVAPLPAARVVVHGVVTDEHRTRALRDMRDFIKSRHGSLLSGIAIYGDEKALSQNFWMLDAKGGLFTHVSIEEVMDTAREYRRMQRRQRSGGQTTRRTVADMVYPVLDKTQDSDGVVTNMALSDIIASKASIFYYESAYSNFTTNYLGGRPTKRFFASLIPDQSILVLIEGARTTNGLLRRIPRAQSLAESYADLVRGFTASLPASQLRLLSANQWDLRVAYRNITPLLENLDRITNKDFVEWARTIEEYERDSSRNDVRNTQQMIMQYAHLNNAAYQKYAAPYFGGEDYTPLADYPLLDSMNRRSDSRAVDHAIAYINAIA